jgi:glycosyltransferase involved in cell wall biosynthesis
MPKVSVILAVYNGAGYLRQAVDSILGQTFDDFELLAVDDGSTDCTAAILDDYSRADSRVKVLRLRNSGRPSIPRNFALDQARGEYLCFIDHDDWSEPDRLRQLVAGLDAHPHWIAAFHDIKSVDSDGHELPGTFLHSVRFFDKAVDGLIRIDPFWYETNDRYYAFMCRYTTGIQIQSAMIARSRIDYASFRFDTEFAIMDDSDMWYRLALQGTIGFLDRVLGYYRQHPISLTRKLLVMARDRVELHRKNFARARARLDAAALQVYRSRMAGLYADLGYLLYDRYDLGAARANYHRALEWERAGRYYVAIAKTFLPVPLLKVLRGAPRHENSVVADTEPTIFCSGR